MRRLGILLAWALAGCSTHPGADLLDYFVPSKVGPTEVQPYGGVCVPQGPIQPPLPSAAPIVLGPGTAPLPPANVVPPPAPLPGTAPLLPDSPAVPPPPPPFPSR
jgi:hypothetical protein